MRKYSRCVVSLIDDQGSLFLHALLPRWLAEQGLLFGCAPGINAALAIKEHGIAPLYDLSAPGCEPSVRAQLPGACVSLFLV